MRLLFTFLTMLSFGFAPSLIAKPKVKVAVATKQKLERKVVYAARLEPNRRVRQQSLFQGKVQKHLVKVGDKVRQGQSIMALERLTLGQDFSGFRVTSHIPGTVNQFFLESGMEFATGDELFEIVDLSKLRARFGISDKDRDTVEPGQEAIALKDGKTVSGQVARLGQAADQTTGLYPLEAVFPADQGLRSGQYVNIQVGARSFEGVAIPRESLVQKFGKPHVFVVNAQAAVELRPLLLGPEFGATIGVAEGLKEGENIILEASENLQDGVEVEVELPGQGKKRG